nr:chemosensory protein 12 [Pachyrhinus yasumatsui]
MKGFVVLLFVGLSGLAYCRPDDDDEHYPTKFDGIDLDALLNNDRLLHQYVQCLLDKGNCTKEGQLLKKYIREAFENYCEKCSERQRNGARKVIFFLIKNKREWWNELQQKYDADNKYVVKYADELKKEGIVL